MQGIVSCNDVLTLTVIDIAQGCLLDLTAPCFLKTSWVLFPLM